MQTLWTRVAQVRTVCSCPQCAASVHGVSRQAAAAATRRMPRYWTSSTIWYSGIFAAAATFDAGIKIQRREKWDMAIAEVKQELDQPEAIPGEQSSVQTAEETRPPSNYEPFPNKDWEELEAYADSSVGRRRKPQWPTNTGASLRREHLPPQSIYATDWRKTKADSTRWGKKKLEKVSLSVDILQLKMFLELQKSCSNTDEAASAVPASYARYLRLPRAELHRLITSKTEDFQRLSLLDGDHVNIHGFERSKGDIPLSNYQQDDLGDYRNAAREMNCTLQDLFHRAHDSARPVQALLAKVYFIIGASSAPPNVDTYNILLANLSHLQQNRLVEDVITSFQQTKMRYNEVSLAAMLNHFTVTSNPERFRQLVLRMRGRNGGLMSARPDIKITDAGRARLVENERNGRILQLPYPTPMVFGALIKGVLHFSGFEKALQICSNMSEEGWGLCMSGMSPLLQDCAERGDWESGLAVWQRIQSLKAKSRKHERNGWAAEVIKPQTYISMLRLCSRAKRQDVFGDVVDQVSRHHPDVAQEIFDMLRTGEQRMEDRDPVRAAVTDASAMEAERLASRETVPNIGSSLMLVGQAAPEESAPGSTTDASHSTAPVTGLHSAAPIDSRPPAETTAGQADSQKSFRKRRVNNTRRPNESGFQRDVPYSLELDAYRQQEHRTTLSA